MEDNTVHIEQNVKNEKMAQMKYLLRLWLYVFATTKKISIIYLVLFLFLSFLRSCLGFLWGKYVAEAEILAHDGNLFFHTILLLLAYSLLNWCADLIESFMSVDGNGDIEQLDAVQANRQQELMHGKMFDKISHINPEYLEIPQINNIINQVFGFAGDRGNGLNRTVMLNSYVVIAKMFSVFFIAATLFFISPWLTILLFIAPLPTLWNSMLGERIGFEFIKDNTELARKAGYFQGLMLSTSAKELKTMGLYGFFYNKWKKCADEYTLKEVKMIRRRMGLGVINGLIIHALNLAGIVIAILFMANGEISLGELAATLSLISVLTNDAGYLFSACSAFLSKKNEAARFFDFMDLPEQVDQGVILESINSVQIKNLKYRYPLTDNYVLDNVDFTMHNGEKIAFVGENGAGKSTFVKILLGILNPSEGEFFVNGQLVTAFQQESRYSCQSIVMQNPSRYVTFSVKENVFMGNTTEKADEKGIGEALLFAGLDEVETDVPLGRDIGGIDMSGGQWQKLAIARAVYRNRGFYVLDEPTGNLDPVTETEIFKKYMAMSKGKTVLFVTHRISLASLADRIIVFDKGKIVEEGTHGQLMGLGGKYAQLYRSQAKWYNR